MSKFEILSVAENNGLSDRITARRAVFLPNRQTVDISVTSVGNMVINSTMGGKQVDIALFDVDFDDLISFLQEAKTYVSEEKMMRKLLGGK